MSLPSRCVCAALTMGRWTQSARLMWEADRTARGLHEEEGGDNGGDEEEGGGLSCEVSVETLLRIVRSVLS